MTLIRKQFELQGRLQGVGFRPLAYLLARELELVGSVCNTGHGVCIEVQGAPANVSAFENRLKQELPPMARIRQFKMSSLDLVNDETSFKIIPSKALENTQTTPAAEVQMDLALCNECAQELKNPGDRRYRYPFIQCTQCGPRYSILRRLPFDRENTSMRDFPMCRKCQSEYEDPTDRRFHCQSICCPECGPAMSFTNSRGQCLSKNNEAIIETQKQLRQGAVIAIMGYGGFHLVADARNDHTLQRMRQSKQRPRRPFAIMTPHLEEVRTHCHLSILEQRRLLSAEAPIVLLKSRDSSRSWLSQWVAPDSGLLGVMFPYSSLYQLLFESLNFPLVVTSGNLSDEPICFEAAQAYKKLGSVADFFLVHDRKIAARIDDSVVREIGATEVVFRAGRGYAPFVIDSHFEGPSALAYGGHQKNALAFSHNSQMVLMPHIGNLDSVESIEDYGRALDHTQNVFGLQPTQIVCDLHPDYASTKIAKDNCKSVVQIQHHQSHLYSCIAEHNINGPVFGIAFDGSGFGPDQSIWGGEFFIGDRFHLKRVGHLRRFRLPGGELAIREPIRVELSLLYEIFGDSLGGFDLGTSLPADLKILLTMMARGLNSPWTSSAGRLYDGVAAFLGFHGRSDYEAQAATGLETAADSWMTHSVSKRSVESYDCSNIIQEVSCNINGAMRVLNWEPWIRGIIEDLKQNVEAPKVAAKFHRSFAQGVVEMVKKFDTPQVVLSGGCFQNKLFSELIINDLREAGFTPFWNQRVPPNDGGLSIGQLLGGANVFVGAR